MLVECGLCILPPFSIHLLNNIDRHFQNPHGRELVEAVRILLGDGVLSTPQQFDIVVSLKVD